MNNFSALTDMIRGFTPELMYHTIKLVTAADVLQFSSFAQASIYYLDLELCQSYKFIRSIAFENYPPSISFPKCFIDSEEKARKTLCPSRNILYSLHLDLPKGRDWSLKNISQPKYLSYCDSIHLAKIEIRPELINDMLFEIIDYACKKTNHGFKVLKWFIKFNRAFPSQLPIYIINHFVDCMQPGISDTDFVAECFKKLPLTKWLNFSEKPGRVKNLLYQIHRSGRKPKHMVLSHEFLKICLVHRCFDYASAVFKFMSELIVTESFLRHISMQIFIMRGHERSPFVLVLQEIGEISVETINNSKYFDILKTSRKLTDPRSKINERRRFLLLHLYWCFLNSLLKLSNACERLSIVWDFIPDTFLYHQEIVSAFEGEELKSGDIERIWKFYSESVGKDQLQSEPRSLKHQCRIIIRRRLWKCNQWLPEGIQQIGLPPKLQSYLNLDV